MDFLSKLFVCVFLAGTFAVLCLGQQSGLDWAEKGMTRSEYEKLDQSVKEIVGPHAKPDVALIELALGQGGYPKSFSQMMKYIPFYTDIARAAGIQQTGTETGPADDIKDIVLMKAAKWIQNHHPDMYPQVERLF